VGFGPEEGGFGFIHDGVCMLSLLQSFGVLGLCGFGLKEEEGGC
jgi:hypothetical protein